MTEQEKYYARKNAEARATDALLDGATWGMVIGSLIAGAGIVAFWILGWPL